MKREHIVCLLCCFGNNILTRKIADAPPVRTGAHRREHSLRCQLSSAPDRHDNQRRALHWLRFGEEVSNKLSCQPQDDQGVIDPIGQLASQHHGMAAMLGFLFRHQTIPPDCQLSVPICSSNPSRSPAPDSSGSRPSRSVSSVQPPNSPLGGALARPRPGYGEARGVSWQLKLHFLDILTRFILPPILGGGAGFLTVYANWGVEKRKQRLAQRRKHIASWRRDLLPTLPPNTGWTGPHTADVMASPAFASLTPHLSPELLRKMRAERTGYVAGDFPS
jgi:hypothetical protein